MTLQFKIEQVALCPNDPAAAKELLGAIGLAEWAEDVVVAKGDVFESPGWSKAKLSFNYQATRDMLKPLELEVLSYIAGDNWMAGAPPRVSHLGMHCKMEELEQWRKFFASRDIGVAQEVDTVSHENPAIRGTRWYKYVIFNTYPVLGVDLKFIVRLDKKPL